MVVRPRLAIVASHAIQYQSPLFRALAGTIDLHVFYANRQSPAHQADAGFGVEFEWDVDLYEGYEHTHLENRASIPSTQTFLGCDTPEIESLLESGRFDAVMTMGWYLKSYLQTIRAGNRLGLPVLVRGDSTLQSQKNVFLRMTREIAYPYLLRKFDAFLVVGKRARSYLEHFGVAEERMFWSPHAVDNDRFGSEAARARNSMCRIRAELGCRAGESLALFVGRFVPGKRPADLVEALAILKRDGLDVRGVFVGAGELEEEIRTLGEKCRVPMTVTGFKNQSQLPGVYAAADVLVLPSDRETWGLVVNEAMASGTPAVVSEGVGCVEDLIEDGETGYGHPVGDVDALARSIRDLLAKAGSAEVRGALERKMSEYSFDTTVDGIVRAIHGNREH